MDFNNFSWKLSDSRIHDEMRLMLSTFHCIQRCRTESMIKEAIMIMLSCVKPIYGKMIKAIWCRSINLEPTKKRDPK
ncbi:hypothetical protein BIY21_07385 [Vibrio ponticus]|uniref:Uncharacterized protein n=1 Tax=Vibrio ponticus TaxID=265668 RepID=A0ABX3FPA1_9VIBR|nr:hypothetical protein BIY21_07385 [Vibrio ponticus]